MCMGNPLPKKKQDQIRADTRKRGYIRVYKLVFCKNNQYTAIVWSRTHGFGIQTSEKIPGENEPGFHAYLTKNSAKNGGFCYDKIIECLAKADWIIDVGTSHEETQKVKTVRLSKLCFPKFPNTKITVREFRQLCKQHGV